MKMKVAVAVLVLAFASMAKGDTLDGSYLVPGSTLTESYVFDNYNFGGGIQNYVYYHEGAPQFEWAHLWVSFNSAYRLIGSPAWIFESEPGSKQWTATLSFSGVETMDNTRSMAYSPAFLYVNGWEARGGVMTLCEYGNPLWVNLNASLQVSPFAKANNFDFQFTETPDPTGTVHFQGTYTAYGEFAPVPEPSALVLMLGVVAGGMLIFRKK